MTAQIPRMSFHCELVTIQSKRTFADLISRVEATFQYYDPKTLRNLTAEGDTEKLAAYVKQVGEPTEFAIFFSLDQGSTQRLAGIPIESRFYLFGNATIAQGLFRYSARAGLGAPVRFASRKQMAKMLAEAIRKISACDGRSMRAELSFPLEAQQVIVGAKEK
jgi:hypothetical protein